MYGSSFQFEQAITAKKFQTAPLHQTCKNSSREKKSLFIVSLVVAMLLTSTVTLAGSKQPKIAGGNGNARGR